MVGGSILSVSIRARLFSVASDADVSMDLGGYSNETQSNGNGTARIIKTRKTWMLENISVVLDPDNNDLEFLQEIADGNTFVPITIELVSGHVYQGKGIVTGDLKGSTQNTTATITLSGKEKLTQQ
jgi:hypothetical protein